MRYRAPQRAQVDPVVFARQPLAAWSDYGALLQTPNWPDIAELNRQLPRASCHRFVAQTPALLAEGLHYEQRIAQSGTIATREGNWHDLLNALVWLRYPTLKQALNRRQVGEIAHMGPRQRSRAQYALTHFDEAGVVVTLRDAELLALWDAHDWHGLFWRRRDAWVCGAIRVDVFGHALLEHALSPDKLLVGKAVALRGDPTVDPMPAVVDRIGAASLLQDPLDLRPLPLSGIPGWQPASEHEAWHRHTPCYQPLRQGRRYPVPLNI